MTLISKLSTLAAVGALLAAPAAMAQQSGTSAGSAQSAVTKNVGKTNMNAGGSNHDTGMANSQGTSYHMGQQGSNLSGNTNNGWNASNTGDRSATSPQNDAVNTGSGQAGSRSR
ncbi:MAG: hypothetical protein JOY66_10455 [Acetobacteraceae bacterium]|nr:hypothetical protein [Acetobacteraceae bacterium]